MSGKFVDVMVFILGESVIEVIVVIWFKKVGDVVQQDEMLCELEIDKVLVEVLVFVLGVLVEILVEEGVMVDVMVKLVIIIEGVVGVVMVKFEQKFELKVEVEVFVFVEKFVFKDVEDVFLVKKVMVEGGILCDVVIGIGCDGCVMKEDVVWVGFVLVLFFLVLVLVVVLCVFLLVDDVVCEECVKMICLCVIIVCCLKDVQNIVVMLIIYNEVDMLGVMDLCNVYKDQFEKKYKVKLGFMFFFVKVCCYVLKEVFEVNVEIDGGDVVYKYFVYMGVVVGMLNGLVVLVVCDVDQKFFVQIEKEIGVLGVKGCDGKLIMVEMQGGIFIILNGGVYGLLMFLFILNLS